MIIVSHRVNSIQDLNSVPNYQGVEIDLRRSPKGIYLQHEANGDGELFIEWIKGYAHELLILNVKEDGLESQLLEIVEKKQIRNFFFLDQPFPTLLRSAALGMPVAYRTSDLEKLPIITNAESNWLWIDSFSGDWKHLEGAIHFATDMGLKTCLVSPELQGRNNIFEIQAIKNILANMAYQLTAVCTKVPAQWEK